MYTVKQIKDTFLNYFEKNGHKIIDGASIVPENDPTLLFINAGMAPMKKVFTGEQEPQAKRMCNVQNCIRTIDIDSIGDRHHLSSFYMLGSWSIGDYFKEGAIHYAFELLTKGFNIPKEKLYVTVFSGDEKRGIPADNESIEHWKKNGIPESHIIRCGFEDNFWRIGGDHDAGPCGPCTEMFYDTGAEHGANYEETGIFDDKNRYIEIWNAGVFMEYYQDENGNYTKLKMKSVDTGSGLERMIMTLNGLESAYDTEVFLPIIEYLQNNSKNPVLESLRIIADHVRTSIFILNAGVEPSNVKRGYVLRRLIRRAIRHMRTIGLEDSKIPELLMLTMDNMKKIDLEPKWNYPKNEIIDKFMAEFAKFSKSLEQGVKAFNDYVKDENNIKGGKLDSKIAFKLFDTFGFPLEITKELASEKGLTVDEKEFNELFEKHREISKTEGTFKSGLADHSEETIKLHTATHLLQAGLRHVLGNHVYQRGSNITPERLRFDFNFERKMTPEEVKEVENFVNKAISDAIPVVREEMSLEDAKKTGAIGLFTDKYGDRVSVYTIGNISKELCSGPHVNNTSELKHFRILKEESSSSGVRRIKAVVEN